jgi:predicted transcriptional regulator
MKSQNAELSSRRDKLSIIVEILSIARKGTPKTRIMYQANMSFASINEYLEYMIQNHLISKESTSLRTFYKCTQKGTEVLSLYNQMTELFNENNGPEHQVARTNPPMYLFAKEY